ncbi:23S rRNA-intervening sequence protein [Idiomarina loihiensis]|uniref:diversity-generating retroelement protein Avd n=1 Tax=Idiomarina TaxID=135575 RepID=UPI000D709AB4|nr:MULTISPECIES: diversity-generating retroelement protein Avd [Idiomarina]PWW41635.1 23S rRNA-intervening sequence protein [Idiomarina loihiensis]TDP50693.1 23S rRNA-intervening sequence protein [Idiomarina loihiensis]TDS25029.1 23S rRNA-intervening sequence protein [Idiomarina sp. H2]
MHVQQDLIVIQRIEEMTKYGYKALAHFPKSERHVLSAEIRQSMFRLLRLMIVVSKRYHKKTTLQDADAELELTRRLVRLAKDLGHLPFKKYEVWSRHLAEIGRFIGSWLKKEKG